MHEASIGHVFSAEYPTNFMFFTLFFTFPLGKWLAVSETTSHQPLQICFHHAPKSIGHVERRPTVDVAHDGVSAMLAPHAPENRGNAH